MPFDSHERARFLIDESRVAGISAEDANWLREHTAECPDCAHQEESTSQMLAAFRQLTFDSGTEDRLLSSVHRPKAGVRSWWPLAAAALLLIAALPLYKAAHNRQEEADALLLERVEAGVSRGVPAAMEPLLHPKIGEAR